MKFLLGSDNSAWYEAARTYVKKRETKKRSRARKKAWKEQKAREHVPGVWNTYITYEHSLVKYQNDIDDIIQIAWATCSSQTKQPHPNKKISFLSHRLAAMKGTWDRIEIEDIEQVVQWFWWTAYQNFRSRVRPYKMPSLRWYLIDAVCFHLPKELASQALNIPHKTNTTSDTIYYNDESDLIEIKDLFRDAKNHMVSLLTIREKLILYLMTEYPGQYTHVARLLQLNPDSLKWILDGIMDKILEENTNASYNAKRLTERRTLISK